MPGPRFFAWAFRMPAYQGVMRERVVALATSEGTPGSAPSAPAGHVPAPPAGRGQRTVVPATKAALQSEKAFAGIFSFSK